MTDVSFDDIPIVKPKKTKDGARELPPITVTPNEDVSFDDIPVVKQDEPKRDDHGYSERRKRTALENAAAPFTDYWGHQKEISRESLDMAASGASDIRQGFARAEPGSLAGLGQAALGAGKLGLGALGYIASPIGSVYRSFLGQPLEDVTGIPREHTEFLAQLATPGIGFTRLAGAPGVAPLGPLIRPPEVPPRPAVLEASQRLNDMGIPVTVPRAVSSDSITAQRTGQGLSNVPYVGNPISRAVHETLPQQLEDARNAVAAEYGANTTGPNTANRARSVLTEGATAETQAATEAAARQDAEALAAWERANAAREQAIAAREQGAVDRQAQSQGAVEARAAPVNPNDTGAATTEAVRAAEAAAEARKNRLYDIAGEAEGTIKAEAFPGLHARVMQDLENAGVVIDPDLTKAANRMAGELRDFENLRIPNRAVGARLPATEDTSIAGVSLQGVERMRKRLVSFSRAAQTDEDRRAARHIMSSFDDWQNEAMQRSLLSGDPQALEKFQEARAANRDWRERFGYNERDDADKLVQKIIHQDVTPNEVANWLIGSGKVGAQGTSSRLYQRVMEATGNNPQLHQAIRGSVWDALSRSADPAKAIREFVNYSGRDLAGRLFSREDQALMLAHARDVDATKAAREAAKLARTEAGAEAKATKPTPTTVEKGPLQQLADKVIGGGQKSDEALFNTIRQYSQRGGDVKTLARVVRQLPEDMRGDLAGTMIRNLGISNRTNTFSLAEFVNQWNDITPQAKAVLFGNAGGHVQALDDIATIAQRLKDVKGRYGNASGTAQNNIFAALAAAASQSLIGTAKTATLAGLGYGAARFLASPAGASSLARYARAVERATASPSPEKAAALSRLERNLLNTARTLAAGGP